MSTLGVDGEGETHNKAKLELSLAIYYKVRENEIQFDHVPVLLKVE